MAYSNTATITIDVDQVSFSAADYTDYEFCFAGTYAGSGTDPDLRTAANGGDIQNTTTGGVNSNLTIPADLIFTSDESGTTQLDHEVAYYDASTGKILCWVNIPTLSYTADTVIYLQYNDSSVTTNQENISGVWGNWTVVTQGNASSGNFTDGSGNGYTATANGTISYQQSGLNGYSITMSGTSGNYLDWGDQAAFSFNGGSPDLPFTFYSISSISSADAWKRIAAKFHSAGGVNHREYAMGYAPSATGFENYVYMQVVDNSNLTNKTIRTNSAFTTGSFGQQVFTYDGSGTVGGLTVYENGSDKGSTTIANDASYAGMENKGEHLATDLNLTYGGVGGQAFQGSIETWGLYPGELSSEWVATNSVNVNTPSTFYSVTTGGGGGTTRRYFAPGIWRAV